VDYLITFATRVRRLRETAGLSIQAACDRGGISPNFWGKVERGEQEPCLLSIGGMAQGLGVPLQVLMALDERPPDNTARSQISDVLDLCNPEQWELSLRIVKAIYEQGPSKAISPDQTVI
jgi:transcriptional regulator with XRE-family HTH domain